MVMRHQEDAGIDRNDLGGLIGDDFDIILK